ncbi:hypothetical protein SDC9_169831 [bioreactor metagenome]|uniref:Uncharacterized protein n=1 Tax=bioreactor metagenome TaxID=1076179 RepID=A0A645G6E6_9ZZZZ
MFSLSDRNSATHTALNNRQLDSFISPNKKADFEAGLNDEKTYLMKVGQCTAVKDININLIV